MKQKFDVRAIEDRWRRAWEEQGIYRTPEPSARPKMYVLDFFPYPSGDGLSVIDGRVRDRITMPPDADRDTHVQLASARSR
ncbi:MAG: hypothetical protein WD140_01635, partial [bacterium]